ncbi:MarR family transcriptional regulator for hemolysin [Sphingobium sp. B2D3A]|uniref:MarR family winged helix-turn-helix transcriptional regulator n=1 Tax=Sphingobium TaxID=165695 RepID=UPI0015EBEBC2|nr:MULTISPECIES: MarR family transcriptional regulator [Sphingobium]MCW2336545.1 MarR family transcriptional regulator for hemolysin [Sphingobium sp. B2D3A]MCW2348985.1 MarR family transcriptional regulator for hemolysin [Sphingobium sp. B12D2B]MCW2363307.1 MarR family transcriptional regulator for hemolysin [Sphingobium sp. B10D3B]MCW2367777.1 MarR family transcriptional regulator for hemolysin [Sphingobium sp. B7D2B]MCW2368114.1 MarR family transcriptional regulator for hemolysin [Sphingobiu
MAENSEEPAAIVLPTITGGSRLDREYGFTYRMILVARRYRAMLDERLRPLGYGSARMEALSTIARSPEPSAQIAIAKRIGIEGPTLTRMLDTLEADGLVVRLQDPSDRRTKLIQLTPAGQEALDEIMAVAHAFRASVLEGLSDKEIDQVNVVTDKLMRLLYESPMG